MNFASEKKKRKSNAHQVHEIRVHRDLFDLFISET